MKNIDILADKAADKYVEGSISMSADAGHGAFSDGFKEGFAEAQRQMYGCALLMPEPHPTMHWLHQLNEWAMSEEDKRFELKFKEET